jgi:hypothetical protein
MIAMQHLCNVSAFMGDALIILAVLIALITGLGVLGGWISWQPRGPRL